MIVISTTQGNTDISIPAATYRWFIHGEVPHAATHRVITIPPYQPLWRMLLLLQFLSIVEHSGRWPSFGWNGIKTKACKISVEWKKQTYLGIKWFLLLQCLLQCAFFSYSSLEVITKDNNKHKHRRPPVVSHITGCSSCVSFSHCDCPLVVSCVSHTWTWSWQQTTINTCFSLHTSYVTFLKG